MLAENWGTSLSSSSPEVEGAEKVTLNSLNMQEFVKP